ncbi:Uncharacterized protein TCM_041236 [Theobroma cacao]|uniref:RNase H type-1 domain-containing protein n=1 Tax=Theobroma cacao TaxID=3641 RepID=A0A061GUX9_THECC|nr:Uncharacterized protein TCM_041236 [Theobroma cacao]
MAFSASCYSASLYTLDFWLSVSSHCFAKREFFASGKESGDAPCQSKRLTVKEALVNRGIISANTATCLLCRLNMELSWWIKTKWPEINTSISNLAKLVNEGTIANPSNSKMNKKVEVWSGPVARSLKFNIDGSVRGYPGDSSIGYILRDEFGSVFIRFLKSIGISNSNRVELLAVKEATIILVASKWCSNHTLNLECDNSNVVKWISNLVNVHL